MLVTSTDDDDDVNMLAPGGRECLCVHFLSLHCALAAAQCIVIGPVCGFVAVFVCLIVCLWVCYHNNLKLCIDLHQTGFVGKGSDHLQMIKFWPSRAPGKGVCGGMKIFGSALLQPVRSVCVSLSIFFKFGLFMLFFVFPLPAHHNIYFILPWHDIAYLC